jgi:uncharacterized protein involved in tolerance to divalent cations
MEIIMTPAQQIFTFVVTILGTCATYVSGCLCVYLWAKKTAKDANNTTITMTTHTGHDKDNKSIQDTELKIVLDKMDEITEEQRSMGGGKNAQMPNLANSKSEQLNQSGLYSLLEKKNINETNENKVIVQNTLETFQNILGNLTVTSTNKTQNDPNRKNTTTSTDLLIKDPKEETDCYNCKIRNSGSIPQQALEEERLQVYVEQIPGNTYTPQQQEYD